MGESRAPDPGADERLRAWATKGLHHVLLRGTLTWVQMRVPNPEMMLRKGVIDQALRGMVLKYQAAGLDLDTMPDEDLQTFLRMLDSMTTYAILGLGPSGPAHVLATHTIAGEERQGPPPDAFTPVHLTPGMLEEWQFDEVDLEDLKAIALRRATPLQVTSRARAEAGAITPAELERVEEEEASDTTPGWSTFRDGSGGPPARLPGGEVGETAELPARDHGEVRSLPG